MSIDYYNLKQDMSLVRKQAPHFDAASWVDGDIKNIKLSDYNGKYVVLFFYPLDFSFVCPTEIIAFSNKCQQFKKNGCQVLACSVDSVYSHMEYTFKSRKDGGIGPVNFPMISDLNKTIAKSYGCLIEHGPGAGVAFRGTYIIDSKGIVRHASVTDNQVGRNPDQYLRLVQAFKHVDQHGEVCPANWKPGSKTMIPNPKENNYKEVIGSLE